MSARLALANLAAWWLQLAILLATAFALARAGRLEAPAALIGYWRAVLLAGLALPTLIPRVAPSSGEGFVSVAETISATAAPGGADVASLLLIGLAAVSGVRLFGLWLGLRRLRRWSLDAIPLADGSRLADCARIVGARADLRVSSALGIPATLGWRRPVVLLPADFPGWAESHQRHALLHELVHVRRGDWIAAIAEEGLAALLWFHPGVRWVVGEVRLAREQAVDQEVAALVGGRRAYAETLLALAARPGSPVLAPALFTSKLERRIEALLKEGMMSRMKMTAILAASAASLVLVASVAARAFPVRVASGGDDPVTGGVEGGVSGGVAGGIEGGVPGGIPGGVAGGVPGGVEGEKKTAAPRKVVQRVNPVYPPEAKSKGIEGDVLLDVLITAAGTVTDVHVLKGPNELRAASESAVRQWKYELAPVDTRANLTLRFALAKRESPQP